METNTIAPAPPTMSEFFFLYRPPQFHMPFVGYFVFLIAVCRILIRENHRRAWIISAFATSMISVLGSLELITWMFQNPFSITVSMSPTNLMLMEFLKAYLLVDVIYTGVWHPDQLGLVDGFIHHAVYILMLERLQQTYQAHVARPFWVLEIPTAIRSWRALGVITPATADRWFGATFFAFRIMWPMFAVTQIVAQAWVFGFIICAIGAHIAWFYSWIKH
jgi:hypothetical protein